MAFRCEVCGEAQETRSSPTMLIVEQRSVNYPERRKNKMVVDRGGHGTETVKELRACIDCATPKE